MSDEKSVFETDSAVTQEQLSTLMTIGSLAMIRTDEKQWSSEELRPALSRASIALLLIDCAVQVCNYDCLDEHEKRVFLQFIHPYVKPTFAMGECGSAVVVGFRSSRSIAEASEEEVHDD